MAVLKILLPEATTNYITNPAIRYDTTGWNAQGSTVTRTLARARFGVAGLQVVTDGAALNEGVYFRASALNGITDHITISAYVRGNGVVRIRLDDNAPGGQEYTSQAVELSDERWTRIEVTGRCHGGDDLRLYVELDEDSVIARTFYVDGAQMERLPNSTTYCDGEQDGCRWSGRYHASTATRPATTRAGGRWVELSGPQRETDDLYMTVAGGLGMPPLINNTQPFAMEPGGYHQNVKVNMRPITFTFHAKHKSLFSDRAVSLERLHELRQLLIDATKPDLTMGNEDIRFEYTDGAVPMYFHARYDGGLEGDWDVRNGNVNSFPLRLLAVSPFYFEDSQEAAVLDFQDDLEINDIAYRKDGIWNNMNYGVNNDVEDIALGLYGDIYICGDFTIVNNDAAAVNGLLALNGIARWNGESWEGLGSGGTGIDRIAVSPNGIVYAAGATLSITDVPAAVGIAYWDGSSWNALGTGIGGGYVNAMVIAPNGDLYVGGNFTSVGGVAAQKIGRWDGSSWHAVGPLGGLNQTVRDMKLSLGGDKIYLTGDFSDQYGLAANALPYAAIYDINEGTFESMGTGMPGGGGAIAISKAGSVLVSYASGQWLGEWRGSSWVEIGSGPNDFIRDISVFDNLVFSVVGDFTTMNGVDHNHMTLWNGSSFLKTDIWLAFSQPVLDSIIYSVVCIPGGDDYIVGGRKFLSSASGQSLIPGRTTVKNRGSLSVRPQIFIKGPGTLVRIENSSTGKVLYFNLTILDGEQVIIDFAKGTMGSELRDSLLYGLLPGSDFRSFELMPGDNIISAFMLNDVDAQMSIQFKTLHWSADATARGEEF